MKKLLSILLVLISLITCSIAFTACGDDEGDDTLPPSAYANGYCVKIEPVQRVSSSSVTPEIFTVNGKTDFDDVIVLYGESLGENLPDLSGLIEEKKNDYEDMYWSAKVNGKIIKIEKDTILDFETLGVDKGNIIILQISCKSFWSDFD